MEAADAEAICAFPQSASELYYIGPRFRFPLTPDQLLELATARLSPTVVCDAESLAPVAYANLYDRDEEAAACWLGNVIVAPSYRGRGASAYLLDAMVKTAADEHGARLLKLICHNTNTKALLFYGNHGFVPCGHKAMMNEKGEKIVGIEMRRTLPERVEKA